MERLSDGRGWLEWQQEHRLPVPVPPITLKGVPEETRGFPQTPVIVAVE